MKIYTILLWHMEANIAVLLVSITISNIMGLFLPPGTFLIPFYCSMYVTYIILSYFYISDKGFKDSELERFSLGKCLLSAIISMTIVAVLNLPYSMDQQSLKLFLTMIPYSFISDIEYLNQNANLWFLILLLLNIPFFTLSYYLGKVHYNKWTEKTKYKG